MTKPKVANWIYDKEGGSILSGKGKVTPKSGHTCIAWVHDPSVGPILSAAPDMYQALKDLLRAYESLVHADSRAQDSSLINTAPIAAKAAMRKAEGKAE